MIRPILFIDLVSVNSYDLDSLEIDVLGGTEATVVRVAEALAETTPVVVVQLCRQTVSRSLRVTYAPLFHHYFEQEWQSIIFIRNVRKALDLGLSLKKASSIWIWLHDLVTADMFPFIKKLADRQMGLITVSDFHKGQVESLYKLTRGISVLPKLHRIYNPIDDDLKPDGTPIDPYKLLYMSSPFKGLGNAIELLQLVRKIEPRFELYTTNPSYVDRFKIKAPGVINLGALKHKENLAHARSSFAVFYPIRSVFPETFGLVFAESNAVGTPVLTYPLGAAPEVLNGSFQMTPTGNKEGFIERLMEWSAQGRPKVWAKEEFRVSNIVQQWKKILND